MYSAHQDPQVHLQLHRDRVEIGQDAGHHAVHRRPRPPSRARRQVADRLRVLADRIDPAAYRGSRA